MTELTPSLFLINQCEEVQKQIETIEKHPFIQAQINATAHSLDIDETLEKLGLLPKKERLLYYLAGTLFLAILFNQQLKILVDYIFANKLEAALIFGVTAGSYDLFLRNFFQSLFGKRTPLLVYPLGEKGELLKNLGVIVGFIQRFVSDDKLVLHSYAKEIENKINVLSVGHKRFTASDIYHIKGLNGRVAGEAKFLSDVDFNTDIMRSLAFQPQEGEMDYEEEE